MQTQCLTTRALASMLVLVVARCCITLVVLAAGPPLRPPLSAQTIGRDERSRGHDMLRTVRERLEKHYYDSTFHGIDDSCYVVRVEPGSDAEAKGLRVGDRVIALGPATAAW